TTAPSSAPTREATRGPARTTGPMPGMKKKAAPKSRPHTPPEGPDPAPGLHAIAGVVVADHMLLSCCTVLNVIGLSERLYRISSTVRVSRTATHCRAARKVQ